MTCTEGCTKFIMLPQRVVLAIMGFLGMVNAYNMRVCLNIAIVEMVGKKAKNGTSAEYCPLPADYVSKSKPGVYDWSSQLQGFILGSFYCGYVLMHVPGGILADKYGGRFTLGLGILSTSLFTIITPVVIHRFGVVGLLILRFLEGLGEGTTFPALGNLLASWIPLGERGAVGAFVLGGGQIGTIFTNSMSGILLHYYAWDSVFYFFGVLGLIWVAFFFLLCYSSPGEHPCIKASEREYLQAEIGPLSRESHDFSIPWRHILASIPLWALTLGQIGHDWGFYIMVSDLPKYMSEILNFTILENGFLSSLPYIAMWIVSCTSGCFNDFLLNRGYMRITFSRKFFTTLASFVPAVFLVLASYSGCDRALTVALFTIAMGFMGFFYCSLKLNCLDLSPNYAGTIMAIVNGICGITGAVTPTLVGFLTADETLSSWRLVFWITFGVLVIANIVYVFFASGEVQYWNDKENCRRF